MGLSKIVRDSLNTGIDDNSDATAITIDSSENVGIGTSTPAEPFHIKGASGAATDVQIQGGDDTNQIRLFIGGNTNRTNGRIIYNTASDYLAFSTGGDQRIRVDSDGLKFGTDTAAANALDSYEEGTFTPSFTGGLTGSSYGDQNGTYVKIGQLVFFVIELDITNGQATANGNQIKIDSIPFVSAAASPMIYGQGGAWVIFNNNFYNVDTGIYLQIPTNTNQIKLYRGAGNALAGNDSGVNGQNDLHIAGCYRTA